NQDRRRELSREITEDLRQGVGTSRCGGHPNQARLDSAGRRIHECCPRIGFRMILAGMPKAIELGGTSTVTSALAPIVQSSPTVRPPRMQAPQPMSTRLPTVGISFIR